MTVIVFSPSGRPAFPVSEGRAVQAIVACLKQLGEPATAGEICGLIAASDLAWAAEVAARAREVLAGLEPGRPGCRGSAVGLRAVELAGETGYALTQEMRDYLRRHGHVFSPRAAAP